MPQSVSASSGKLPQTAGRERLIPTRLAAEETHPDRHGLGLSIVQAIVAALSGKGQRSGGLQIVGAVPGPNPVSSNGQGHGEEVCEVGRWLFCRGKSDGLRPCGFPSGCVFRLAVGAGAVLDDRVDEGVEHVHRLLASHVPRVGPQGLVRGLRSGRGFLGMFVIQVSVSDQVARIFRRSSNIVIMSGLPTW